MLAWRMERQHLAHRAGALDVVSRICGLHAQVMSSAALTLWARVEDTPDVERCSGSGARWSRRGRCAARCTCCAPTSSRSTSGAQGGAASRATSRRSGCSHFELTAEEAQAILDRGPRRAARRPAHARGAGRARRTPALSRGFGDLLKPVAFRGDLIFAPSEGQNVRFALPEPFEPIDTDEATRELARRFLTRYGPATREEFAKWFGAPSPAAPGRWIKALGDDVAETEFGWMLAADVAACEAAAPSGVVRLLPAFDQYVVAAPRDDRATTHPERIYRPGGWFSPVLLVDGVMAGIWRLEGDELTIEPFATLGAEVRAAAEAEAARLPGTPACHLAELTSAHAAARHHLRRPTAPAGARSAPHWPAPRGRVPRPRDPDAGRRPAAVPIDDALAHDESLGDAIGRLVSSFALLPELAGAMVQAGCLAGEDYRRETERLIREHADGGAVILGRAGAVILRDHPDALHVRLDGPPERRVAQAMELEGLTAPTPSGCARAATAPARPTCATSTAATRRDPALYHLVIDSTALPTTTVVEVIAAAAR